MSYMLRETIFNKIMVTTRKILYFLLKLDKHKKFKKFYIDKKNYIPLLSYNIKEKHYRFNCYCFSCPCNIKGLCATKFGSIPRHLMHEFDGDNIIKNLCG